MEELTTLLRTIKDGDKDQGDDSDDGTGGLDSYDDDHQAVSDVDEAV